MKRINVNNYNFLLQLPLKLLKLDLSTIIRNIANKIVLWEVPCVKRAFIFQNNNGETILKTDGINIVVSKNFCIVQIRDHNFVFYYSFIIFFVI